MNSFVSNVAVCLWGVVFETIAAVSSVRADDMNKKIVVFHEEVGESAIDAYAAEWALAGAEVVMKLPFINGLVMTVPQSVGNEMLTDDPRVDYVEDDQKVELQSFGAAGEGGAVEGGAGEGGAGDEIVNKFIYPLDEKPISTYTRPWGMLRLYGQYYEPSESFSGKYYAGQVDDLIIEARRKAYLTKIKVAVFDTGMDVKNSRIRDFVKGGIGLFTMTPGAAQDDNGHGTHVAGSIGGASLGIARRVHLYSVKVLDKNASGDVSKLIMAFQWAIDNDIDIINMSIAFSDDRPGVRLAVQKAHEAGIVMVAAAGNHSNWDSDTLGAGEGGAGEGGAGEGGAGEGGATGVITAGNGFPVMYPAAYPEVIAVVAEDQFGNIAPYSNLGQEVDIIARDRMLFPLTWEKKNSQTATAPAWQRPM